MDSTLSNPFLVNLTSKLDIVKQIGHTDLENLSYLLLYILYKISIYILKIYIDI